MPKQVRVNIRSVINKDGIRKEKRNGREVMVVPSVTMPDDIVLNGVKYPADEIASSFHTLERTPAPFGHPTVNGAFVSASDPVGINMAYIGAHNENVRQHEGRVFLDKIIDVEVANRTDSGKEVLNALKSGDPIHTSTGLLCNLEDPEDDSHEHIARNLHFDHDAILLHEEGAATPADGVGMMVNSDGEKIEVINSSLAEWAERDLDWAIDSAMGAMDRLDRATLGERLKSLLLDAFSSEGANPSDNQENDDMADNNQLNALSEKVNALSDSVNGMDEKIAKSVGDAVANALKPLTDQMTEVQNAQKAKDDAEKSGLVEKIVKANVMSEDAAKELTLNAARDIAKNLSDGTATAINGNGSPKKDDEWSGYSMNAAIEESVKDKEAA